MVVQVANEAPAADEQDEGYVPYVSAGGRSLRAELRSAPPAGSQARWSELPEEDRAAGRSAMRSWRCCMRRGAS